VSAAGQGAADLSDRHRIAVLLPCHNEAAAVAEVVGAFRAALPGAVIYVYDNNSTDRTIDIAQAAGAVVRRETHQGKGYVVRRMFADVDADIYVLSFSDMLSGYRAFSRRFVKSFPVLSGGFEIETELTIHALELELPVAEVRTPYYARPEGSASKLNTWRDGFRILRTILKIYRAERPLPLFTAIGLALAAV